MELPVWYFVVLLLSAGLPWILAAVNPAYNRGSQGIMLQITMPVGFGGLAVLALLTIIALTV